jgi:hypothetical protein
MKQGTQADPWATVLVDSGLAGRWNALVAEVNGMPLVGTPGVRDVEHPCAEYDGLGQYGDGLCLSDGHYECRNCSHLSPDAPQMSGIKNGASGT